MTAPAYKPVHGGRAIPRPLMPVDGSACGVSSSGSGFGRDRRCVLKVGHDRADDWHDDGFACWPVE